MIRNENDAYRLDWKTLKGDWWLMVIMAAVIVAGIIVYPQLPARVPSHWNAAGQVNGYASREWGAFGLPLLNVGLYLMFIALPLVDPRRANYAKFIDTFRFFKALIVLFLSGMWAVTIAAALGYNLPTDRLIPAAISLLFIAMGNAMGRIRQNYFIGIRTPWSLANEEVWRETHRVGGKLWVAGGLIGLVGAFLGRTIAPVLFIVGVTGAALGSVVYSYIAFRRWEAKGVENK